MHFSTAFVLSVISISISSIAAAPVSLHSNAVSNLAERDLNTIYPGVELERRNDFMDISEELEQRNVGDEEIGLALRDLIKAHQDLIQRDANGELSEVERRWNWRKVLGGAAKIGLKVASAAILKRDEPELELFGRDFMPEHIGELLERDIPLETELA